MAEHHFMLDLETQSTRANAAIVSIGIVYLRLHETTKAVLESAELYLRTAPHEGAHVCAETLAWWRGQNEQAQREVDGSLARINMPLALELITHFMQAQAPDKARRLVWGNGPSFDNAILTEVFRSQATEAPWEYWNDRDLRTLLAIQPAAKRLITFSGIRHHALHDARHEAALLACALQLQADQAPQQALPS